MKRVIDELNGEKMKLLILGHARHGKDTLAEILRDHYGFKFQSSSQAASDIFIYDALKKVYRYDSAEECFEDRVNHRKEWHDLICWYNSIDKARLAKDILSSSDCYVGMRDGEEIMECMKQKLFDLIIWVDAGKRLPEESQDSFDISIRTADIIIQNNGGEEEFKSKVIKIFDLMFGRVPDRGVLINDKVVLCDKCGTEHSGIKECPDSLIVPRMDGKHYCKVHNIYNCGCVIKAGEECLIKEEIS